MKYKHKKTGIVVEWSYLSDYYYNSLEKELTKIPKQIIEDSTDWEKVVEIPQELKDKLMEFWEEHEIYNVDTEKNIDQYQFQAYFGI